MRIKFLSVTIDRNNSIKNEDSKWIIVILYRLNLWIRENIRFMAQRKILTKSVIYHDSSHEQFSFAAFLTSMFLVVTINHHCPGILFNFKELFNITY